MCIFAKYRDIFGKPRQGFHEARIPGLDLALWDTLGTIFIAVVIGLVSGVSVWICIAVAFAVAIVLHWLFCVRTTMTVTLGLVPSEKTT